MTSLRWFHRTSTQKKSSTGSQELVPDQPEPGEDEEVLGLDRVRRNQERDGVRSAEVRRTRSASQLEPGSELPGLISCRTTLRDVTVHEPEEEEEPTHPSEPRAAEPAPESRRILLNKFCYSCRGLLPGSNRTSVCPDDPSGPHGGTSGNPCCPIRF